jgi:hypothetical protein
MLSLFCSWYGIRYPNLPLLLESSGWYQVGMIILRCMSTDFNVYCYFHCRWHSAYQDLEYLSGLFMLTESAYWLLLRFLEKSSVTATSGTQVMGTPQALRYILALGSIMNIDNW